MRFLIRQIIKEETEQVLYDSLWDESVEYLKNNNQIHSLEDLRDQNRELYNKLLDNGMLREIAEHFYFDDLMGPDRRKIYVYWWDQPYKVAYVGLTCDIEGRHKKHTVFCSSNEERNTAVGREIVKRKNEGIEPIMPNYDVIVTKFLSDEDAAENEKIGYDLYKTEYKMLNKPSMIGNLGAKRQLSKYDRPEIWNTLKKHKIGTLDQLNMVDPDLADYVKTLGPEKYALKGKKDKSKYSLDDMINKAKEIGKEKPFKDQYPHFYKNLFKSQKVDREVVFQPEYKIEGRNKIYRTLDDLMKQLDPNLRKIVLKNRLVKRGSTEVRDKDGNFVTVSYPNFMEERYLRKFNKILLEIIQSRL